MPSQSTSPFPAGALPAPSGPADTTASPAGARHCQGLIRCRVPSGAGHLFGFGPGSDTVSRLAPLPRVTATRGCARQGRGARGHRWVLMFCRVPALVGRGERGWGGAWGTWLLPASCPQHPQPPGSEFLHGAECSCSPKPQNLGVLSREMSMGFSALRAVSAPLVGAAMGSALPERAQAVGMVQGWLLSPCCSPPSSPAQPCGEASADVQVLNYR